MVSDRSNRRILLALNNEDESSNPPNLLNHVRKGVRNVKRSMIILLIGITTPLQAQETVTFHGDSAGDQFGISLSNAGDVNGDGFDDLIVGAPRDDNNRTDSGSASVFSGMDGRVLYTSDGDSTDDRFGTSVSRAGDVNGDGFADWIVGARLDDDNGENSGSARVFSGVDGRVLYTFRGDSAGDDFGVSVSGAGDVNGDGFDDLIVGARYDDNNGTDSGSARVFSGVDGSVLYTLNGDSAGDRFGRSVADAGDVNNDGFCDLIVGATLSDTHGSDFGSARVFSGKNGSTLYTLSSRHNMVSFFRFSSFSLFARPFRYNECHTI